MAKQTLDKEIRKAIRDAKEMIEGVAKADGNESETRRRVERLFGSLMGYDVFKHVTRELAVRGAGTTEYCDFAIQIDEGENPQPIIMIELKRVSVDLSSKHLKQVSSYAINEGCEWILLTNGREWRLYHVAFGQPPETKLIEAWNLLTDEPQTLFDKFSLIGYKNVKRGGLDELWQKANVLTRGNVLKCIISEDGIKLIRKELKRITGVNVTPEEIVGSVRRLLNEAALNEFESVKISLPPKKVPKRRRLKKNDAQVVADDITEQPSVETIDPPPPPR